MRRFMEAQELNFSVSLQKMLGVNKEQIEEIIERLDVDELSNLIDACGKEDIDAVKAIVGETDESEEPEKKNKTKTKDELRGLILRKDDAKKIKSKKHKLQKKELGEEDDAAVVFSLGDEVLVNGEEATVKIPQAPGGTVGVMINGELKMVDKKTSNITKVEEGVLGMTNMPNLNRIKELAGMDSAPAEPETLDSLDYSEPGPEGALPALEAPMGDTGPDLGGSADMGGMGGLDADMGDMDMGMGASPAVTSMPPPPMAAPAPVPAAPAPDMSSDAMVNIGSALEDAAALDNAITEIEHMIPNCKISEFKTLVSRLEGLVAMAKSAGKAALTESAKRKARVAEAEISDTKKKKKENWRWERSDNHDADDYLQGDDYEDVAPFKGRSKFEEGKLKPKTEDALDTDGDDKAEEKTERKTLLDYVKEAEEEQTLGANSNDAVKALQARMGPRATPQDARKAFDSMKTSQMIKQSGGRFTIPSMSDDDLNAAISGQTAGKPGAPAPAQSPNKTSYQQSTNKQSNPAGGGNGYQGQ